MGWERSAFVAVPGNVPLDILPDSIRRLVVQVAWGVMETPPPADWLAKARQRYEVYAWAWCDGKDVAGEAEVHSRMAEGYPAFSANMEEPYDAHGDSNSPRFGMPTDYLAALDYDGELALTTTPRFASDMTAWIQAGAIYQPQAFSLETGVGLTECVTFAQSYGWPLHLIRPLVQAYPTRGYRPNAEELNHEATGLGVGGIPYTIEQASDPEGQQWLETMRPTIERVVEGEEEIVPDQPHWSEKGYPGGPMVAVKGFPRPMYPPDAKKQGKTPSKDGPDVVAYKRTVSRAGRWTWQKFDDTYSDNFAHGKNELADSGVAGIQKQQKIDATGWIGEKTFNSLRSIRVPEGLPNAGEPAMDATAANLINDAWDIYQGNPDAGGNPRDKAMSHLEKRVGYTEQPADSNCDNRSDGIRTAQDHTAGGGTWLRYEPWCGCWCYYALEAAGVAKIDSHLASVSQIEDYARNGSKCYRGWTTDRSKIKKGDLVIVGGYGVHVETVRGKPGRTVRCPPTGATPRRARAAPSRTGAAPTSEPATPRRSGGLPSSATQENEPCPRVRRSIWTSSANGSTSTPGGRTRTAPTRSSR